MATRLITEAPPLDIRVPLLRDALTENKRHNPWTDAQLSAVVELVGDVGLAAECLGLQPQPSWLPPLLAGVK